MRILGVDTATSLASIALVEDGRLVAEALYPPRSQIGFARNGKNNHGETVLPLIQSVLDAAAIRLADLDAVAVSIGPGSFTGLRIGLALVKGLAYDCELPVIDVSSLEARAAGAKDLPGLICALLDARKQEVYTALFEARGGKLQRRMTDQALNVSALANAMVEVADSAPIVFVGNGADKYRRELHDIFNGRAKFTDESSFDSAAVAVARLAEERYSVHRGLDLGRLEPLYLGASQALGNTRGIIPNSLK